MKRSIATAFLCLISASCTPNAATPPPATETHAGVFRSLDGVWEGTFTVYADSRGQQEGPRPESIDPAALAKAPYRKELELSVRQEYVSESPTFQRVTIRDTYADGRVVESSGFNKVENGALLCVVKKPDDLVEHTGSQPEPDTIIWQRDRREPLAVEWFRETVKPRSYTIVGWGYYGSDDVAKAPRLYFHARYERVK